MKKFSKHDNAGNKSDYFEIKNKPGIPAIFFKV